MATTEFARTDALTVEHWARMLSYDIVWRTPISPLIGTDENSIIHLKNDARDVGDKVTFPLQAKLTGEGFTEGELAEGNGEALSLYTDSITLNELGHVVGVANQGRSIDAQRTRIPLRQALNTDSSYGSVSDDQSLAAGDEISLEHIDYAVAHAKSLDVPVRPINIRAGNGGADLEEPKYVMFLHPYQVRDLRTAAGTSLWQDIHQSAIQGGQISRSPIYTGALGEYNGVILRESLQVTQGVHSSTGAAVSSVRRAVLTGAQAAAIAFASGSDATSMAWNEELHDHKRRLEVSAMKIYGMKKCRFRSADHSVIVLPTYAAS